MENKEADVEYQQGHFKKEKILFVVYLVHHYLATRHSPLAHRTSPFALRPSLNSLSQINPRPLALHGTEIGNDPIV
jgi:hypothetical protein